MQTRKSSSVAYTKKEHKRRLTSVSTTTTHLLVPNGYCWLKICGTYCESLECISLLQGSDLSSVSQYFKATWDQPTRGKWIPHRIVWLKMSCRQHRRQEEWPLRACAKTVVDLTITHSRTEEPTSKLTVLLPKKMATAFFEIPHGSTVKLQTSLGPSASSPFLCGGSRNSQGIPVCQP